MVNIDACLFNHLLWEYKILFMPKLSGKQLERKTGAGVNGKTSWTKSNNSTEYLLLVQFLEIILSIPHIPLQIFLNIPDGVTGQNL
jgi:hypothetical protein